MICTDRELLRIQNGGSGQKLAPQAVRFSKSSVILIDGSLQKVSTHAQGIRRRSLGLTLPAEGRQHAALNEKHGACSVNVRHGRCRKGVR